MGLFNGTRLQMGLFIGTKLQMVLFIGSRLQMGPVIGNHFTVKWHFERFLLWWHILLQGITGQLNISEAYIV